MIIADLRVSRKRRPETAAEVDAVATARAAVGEGDTDCITACQRRGLALRTVVRPAAAAACLLGDGRCWCALRVVGCAMVG